MNRYYDRLLPLFRQFLPLPNRSNKFADDVIENYVCGKQHGSEMVSGLVSNIVNATGGG